VDEVRSPRDPSSVRGPELALELVEGLLDRRGPEAGRSEEPEEAGPRHCDHQAAARDAIRHGAGHVGKTNTVDLAERPIAQPLGVDRRQCCKHGPGRRFALGRHAMRHELSTLGDTERATRGILHHVGRAAKPRQHREQIRLLEGRDRTIPDPDPDRFHVSPFPRSPGQHAALVGGAPGHESERGFRLWGMDGGRRFAGWCTI